MAKLWLAASSAYGVDDEIGASRPSPGSDFNQQLSHRRQLIMKNVCSMRIGCAERRYIDFRRGRLLMPLASGIDTTFIASLMSRGIPLRSSRTLDEVSTCHQSGGECANVGTTMPGSAEFRFVAGCISSGDDRRRDNGRARRRHGGATSLLSVTRGRHYLNLFCLESICS